MAPLITVILAIATSCFAFGMAVHRGDILKGSPVWVELSLFVASGALYLLAGILAVIHWRKEHRKENIVAASPVPPFTQVIKQEANPQMHQTVIVHRDAPAAMQRTAAEQHDHDTVKRALRLLKEPGLAGLRHIRRHGSLTFGGPGTAQPILPPTLTFEQALWVYRHCASEGILTCKSNLGNTEQTFSVSPKMEKALDELLYEEKGLSGFSDVRRE